MGEEDDEDAIEPLTIDCGHHGKCLAAVVCGHHLNKDGAPLGFIENSSHPNDLQAWCYACEERFVEEGDMTAAFREFTQMAVVCTHCYEEQRRRHEIVSH